MKAVNCRRFLEIRKKANQLKELSKKYGYDLKHTHALEIVSQLDQGVNRHVGLKKEKKPSLGLDFSNPPMAINNPFYKGSVIEISSIDETIDFLVTDNQYICLEDILEFTDKVQSIRFLTQEEVSKKGFSFKLDGEDDPIPFNSLLEWIEKRASEESSGTFLLATKDL